MKINYPARLLPGATIAVPAPSSGVSPNIWPRLDSVISGLQNRGYQIVEGELLRKQRKNASGSREERAVELWRFLVDPKVAAIIPPWGGELAIELLPLIDFQKLKSMPPKWFLGYSDISTILMPLTLISGWATAHGPNLMDQLPEESEPLTCAALKILERAGTDPIVQYSSSLYQEKWADWNVDPLARLNLTAKTEWRVLGGAESVEIEGRLIGGCIDTVARLAGTRFAEVASYVDSFEKEGVILYLENCELKPCELARALSGLRLNRWFDRLAGVVFGRNSAADPTESDQLNYEEAIRLVLGDLTIPIVLDADIGHTPPQLTLINGAFAQIKISANRAELLQFLR